MNDPEKGLSFKNTGELNMKLGLNNFSAKKLLIALVRENYLAFLNFLVKKTKAK